VRVKCYINTAAMSRSVCLFQLEGQRDRYHTEVTEHEHKFAESVLIVERLEKAKSELANTLADAEDEKTQLKKRLQSMEVRLVEAEESETDVRREMDESMSTQMEVEEKLRLSETRLLEVERDSKSLRSKNKEIEAEKETIRVSRQLKVLFEFSRQ
jgi:chromosome segregation ATPase